MRYFFGSFQSYLLLYYFCFCFKIHQPYRLKRYRFFEIGNDHYYYDDFANESNTQYLSETCYLEANKTMLEMIQNSNKKFKVSFAISGLALEQFEQYAPEVIDSFRELAKTGCVEFLAMPYANSLAAVYNENEFQNQVKLQSEKIKELFGKTPSVFFNTEMIYSDEIAYQVAKMGYKYIEFAGFFDYTAEQIKIWLDELRGGKLGKITFERPLL